MSDHERMLRGVKVPMLLTHHMRVPDVGRSMHGDEPDLYVAPGSTG